SIVARGGGARSDLWLQIQADIFNSKVLKVDVEEDPAFGAALLAGIGIGIYRDFKEACEKTVRFTTVKYPDGERVKIYNRIYSKIYRNLYYSLRDYWAPN
ncbi:MAG: FGGY-family carbohydrate kinase, partial [Candidatus Bathyarchaeia archaeon]